MNLLLDLRAALGPANRLDTAARYATGIRCKICGDAAADFDLVDFNKCCFIVDSYPFGLAGVGVRYLRCDTCRFIFTADFDRWTPEDFAKHVYNADYIKVDGEYAEIRPRHSAEYIASKLKDFHALRILDYGSGGGVFANEMRTVGFRDVCSYDPFSSPKLPTGQFDVVTSFEVLEHSADPVSTLKSISSLLTPEGLAVIQTGIQPDDIDVIRGRWWYIAPRNGHISIFTLRALSAAAKRAALHLKTAVDSNTHDAILCRSLAGTNPALLAALSGGPSEDYLYITLTAPDEKGRIVQGARCTSASTWHSIEQMSDGLRFRWSRERVLSWEIDIAAATRLDIELPIVMAITPEFSSALSLFVNGQAVHAPVRGGRIGAIVHGPLTSGKVCVDLHTPEPITPAALGRNSDLRPLGIALPVAPQS
jgi:2-polyprenyl-6-hydroxyphenyl methylase/3-demethylubiquinone-9 3-methyltransferase